MNNRLTVRGMTECAIMAGLAFILMMIGNLPVIGVFVLLFCSVPITIATIRHGSFAGGLASVLTTILLALLLGPLSAISCGLQYVLLGWVMGYMLHHHKSGNKTIHACVITAVCSALAMLLINLALMGFTPEGIASYLDSYRADMLEMYESTGMTGMLQQQGLTQNQVTEMLMQTMDMALRLMPAMMIISRSIMAVITYVLTIQILKRLKIRIPRIQNFQKWVLPGSFVWVLIAVWALWLAGDYINVSWINILALNFLIVCGALLFLDGLALGSYWFQFSQMSTAMKVLGVVFVLFFFTGFLIACVLLGLADLLFDFRKLRVDNKKVK